MEILKPKIQETNGIIDVLMIGLSKSITESILAPVIGNATMKSAIIKGILGGVLHGRAGKYGNIIASGLIIDASEDMVKSTIMPMVGGFIPGMGGEDATNAPNPFGL